MSEDPRSKIEQLEQAIAAQEGLRGTLDDVIIDATIAALRKQLDEMERSPEPEQQRKQMTVLFMDVVGSTRLLGELDPEENMAIMDVSLKQLTEPVERFGGRVLRFMGDGYLAVFGLPRARENDPEMAVRAGLGVLDTAWTIAGDLETEHNLKGFQVRIGVNTGLVVAGGVTEGKATIMGPAVNLAARLERSAPPGGLLISKHTHQHVRGLFDFEPGEAIQAKGFTEPVRVYLVRRARPRAFRLTTRGVEGVETPMIGREAELSSLQEAMKSVDQSRRGKAVTIVGEAGLGKSRLLAEFENWLNHQPTNFEHLKGRASLETLDLPYGLLRDLIAHRVGILDDDPIPGVRRKIVDSFREVIGEDRNLERNAHFVGQLLGYDFRESPHLQGVLEDPRQLHDRAVVYLADYIRKLSADRALAIFLEDVHWADGSSLDVLLHLFHELASQRVLVVALTRPSLFERRPAWGDGAGHQRVELHPLSRLESGQLVGEVLQKVEDLPDTLRDLIIENGVGNPFYMEELIKMLVEDGVIVKSDPRWRVKADGLGKVRIPPTLTGVIQARIDGLSTKERRVMQQASVIGRVFWDEAVCYLDNDAALVQTTDQMDALVTKHTLGTLQAREMIFEQATSAFSDAVEYRFKHAVLREVTYESVLKRMRRVYHALAADWLIAHSGDREGEVTGLIAGHLEKAGNMDEALKYLSQAAEAAVSNYATDEAEDFYTRALALTPEEDVERRYTLLLGRLEVFNMQGNRTAQRAELVALTSIADRLSDIHKRAEVSLGWAWLLYWVSDISEAMEAAKRALDLAEPAKLHDLAGRAYAVMAWAGFQLREYESALFQAKMALELARRTDNHRVERISLMAVGTINSSIGNYTVARTYQESALALAREIGDPAQEATALGNLGVNLTLLGDFPKAQDMYQQLLDISRDIGEPVSQAVALVNLGWVSSAQGLWDLARDHSLAGVEMARKIDFNESVAEGLVWLGHAWLGLGQPEKAAVAYLEALDIRRALNQSNLAMGALAGLARAALVQGDLTIGLERINEILTYLAAGGTLDGTWEPLRIYQTCVQVLEVAEDERAVKILEDAYDFLQERAARISDEDDRRLYLEHVPWHREIVAVWESRQELG
jgi:class 3 adenylate cyclase/tetratricopeptide (TPR) repeat protein